MFYRNLFVASAFYLGLAKAEQASNFDVSVEVAEQYGCDQVCQQTLAAANIADLKTFGTDFDFDFYATAQNFSSSQPGDVLKFKPMNSTTIDVSPGTSVFKMQYTSEDLDGSPVPVTAMIAFPYAKNEQPFDVVAWAHGTSGGYRGCAPSTSPSLYEFSTAWSALIHQGYAVVATDYAGLGNNYTEHKYMSNAAHANDVVYSVIAAKKAFAQYLSNNWVSIGHSQGGSAVWKLSEHKLVQDTSSGYLGGVAMAPAGTRIIDTLEIGVRKMQNATDSRVYNMLPGAAAGVLAIQRVFPDYEPTLLSSATLQRLKLSNVTQACVIGMSALVMTLPVTGILNDTDLSHDTYMQKFQELNGAALGASASKPLLVVHGEEDTIIPYEANKAAWKDSCSYGNPVQLSLYPGLDHSSLLFGASPEWLGFIADRFANAAFNESCTQSEAQPFNLQYAKSPN
ncbi:unnamed protein product [Clonostachys rosea]|uniref:Serine aminopeptidase S33 domain-containing protein n=1 Tax=Bionectria ochroleuca TaxID=29856 RepID=A0ABY6TRD1_BIOOC|nr:unnamed protein product [Clonostachys rosea]